MKQKKGYQVKGRIEYALLLATLQSNSEQFVNLWINPEINWSLFYKFVRRHRVWHQVHKSLIRLNLNNDATLALAKHCKQDTNRILITAGETVRISRAFTNDTVQHCFIKGTLLNMHIYGGLNTRPCRDIDVWVDDATYSRAIGALLLLGYEQTMPLYALTDFKKDYYMRHKHDMVFQHPSKDIIVELHFRLSYFAMDFFPLKHVPLQPIYLLHMPILAPEDDYHLLYLMLHGAIHAWIRLRWLQDIALFIENRPCDLAHVYRLAKEINCQHIVEQSLLLVNRLFGVNAATMSKLLPNPNRRVLFLTKVAQEFIEADYEMIDGIKNPKMFFKYRVYLFTLAIGRQKIHAMVGDLCKIDVLFEYVTFPKGCSFLYYISYPLWVVKFLWKAIVSIPGVPK